MSDQELLIPTVSEICKAIDGDDSTSLLSLMIQVGIELGAIEVNLVAQEPSFYCPTGLHDTEYAVAQGGSERVPTIVFCPTHLGIILRQNPTWPAEHTEQKVIYTKIREE